MHGAVRVRGEEGMMRGRRRRLDRCAASASFITTRWERLWSSAREVGDSDCAISSSTNASLDRYKACVMQRVTRRKCCCHQLLQWEAMGNLSVKYGERCEQDILRPRRVKTCDP